MHLQTEPILIPDPLHIVLRGGKFRPLKYLISQSEPRIYYAFLHIVLGGLQVYNLYVCHCTDQIQWYNSIGMHFYIYSV